MGGGGRDVAAGLRQKGDQGVLAQKGGFAGHVRAGQQPDGGGVAGCQGAVIGDEGLAAAFQGALDHRVAACGDLEGAALVDLRLCPVFRGRKVGKSGGKIGFGQRAGGGGDGAGLGKDLAFQGIIVTLFNLQRVVGGVEDSRFQLVQRKGGKADLPGGGLAVDEQIGHRAQAVFMGGRDFDEVAQDVVVLDLQAGNAGFFGVVGLHAADDATAFVPQDCGFRPVLGQIRWR